MTDKRWAKGAGHSVEHHYRWTVLAQAFVASLVLVIVLERAQAVPSAHAFGTEAHHELITREALPFLQPTVVDKVVQADLSQDKGFFDPKYASHHFDDCRFTRTTDYLRDQSDTVVRTLRADERPQPLSASYELGRMLHPAQDFYAHSNWVEMQRADLLDFGLGNWRRLGDWTPIRDDIIVGQGEHMPAGWSRASSSGSRLPTVNTPAGPRRAVITGTTAGGPVDACHDDFTLSHVTLNKDSARRPGFGPARDLAVRQTQHEWCRLLHRLNSRYGAAGPSAALGLLVHRDRSPHPAGTPCANSRGGFSWRVRVTSVRVKDTRDGGDAGQINLAAVLFHSDFHGSARSQTGPTSVRPGRLVPASRLPGVLTVCTNPGQTAVATVQGWDDDDGQDGVLDIASGGDKRPGHYDTTDTDDVIEGVTLRIAGPGTRTVSSRDLTVNFVVEHPTLPDPCQTTNPN